MLLQIRYGSGSIVGDVLLGELQELVDEDQRRARPLEVLHRDTKRKASGSADGCSRD